MLFPFHRSWTGLKLYMQWQLTNVSFYESVQSYVNWEWWGRFISAPREMSTKGQKAQNSHNLYFLVQFLSFLCGSCLLTRMSGITKRHDTEGWKVSMPRSKMPSLFLKLFPSPYFILTEWIKWCPLQIHIQFCSAPSPNWSTAEVEIGAKALLK